MPFKIEMNVGARSAAVNSERISNLFSDSVTRLSSGISITNSRDDASGMRIANSLRSQSQTLGQSLQNANESLSVLQIAEGEVNRQVKIMDVLKVKTTQAAQAGQTTETRESLQEDINALMKQLDAIASDASYNGQSLLSGSFTNKQFQVGSNSGDSIKLDINATSSDKLGQVRFETSANITASGTIALKFNNVDGFNDITLGDLIISTSSSTSLKALAETINRYSDDLDGVKAEAQVVTTGSKSVQKGRIDGLVINNITIGNITDIALKDNDGHLSAAINEFSTQTGVTASTDSRGHLVLTSNDGRAIQISASGDMNAVFGIGGASGSPKYDFNAGRLTLTRIGSSDIDLTTTGSSSISSSFTKSAEATVNLRSISGTASADIVSAMGFNANLNTINIGSVQNAGVTTLKGAMSAMTIIDSANDGLHKTLLNIGSTQKHLQQAIGKIAIEQVNLLSSESRLRDVDFAAESANFTKLKLLTQAGSYVASQAYNAQMTMMKLLQL
jgi:flagellin